MNDKAQTILTAALGEAELHGYEKVTRSGVAKRADVSEGLVNVYFETMEKLRDRIVQHAVEVENLTVIAQALGRKHLFVTGMEPGLKIRALNTLT